MANLITGARTLAEWGQFFTENGEAKPVIELLTKENSILDDIPFLEGNETDGHSTNIRTGLPEPVFVTLYDGPQPTKAKIAEIKDTCGMMEDRSEIDKRMLEKNGNSATYRLNEANAHIEGMKQKTAETLIYGNYKTDPKTYNGLSIRYPYKNSPNVIDALGTGTKCTDIWLIVWGDNECHGIFPKGTKAGLEHMAMPGFEPKVNPSTGGTYYVAVDTFAWKQGLCVRDWRCVVRICNIDTTKLALPSTDANYIDLRKLFVQGKNKIPAGKRARIVAYCNEDVMTALEIAAGDPKNVQLRYGEWQNMKEVPMMHGIPVREVEAILSTQTALVAAP